MLRASTTISHHHDYLLGNWKAYATLYIYHTLHFYTLSTFNACPSFCLSRRIMEWTWDLGSDGNRAWTGQDGTQDQRAAFSTHQACIPTQRSAQLAHMTNASSKLGYGRYSTLQLEGFHSLASQAEDKFTPIFTIRHTAL
jgi:hypothetical protein